MSYDNATTPAGWCTVADAAPWLGMSPQGCGQLLTQCPTWLVRYDGKRRLVREPEFVRWYWRRLRQRTGHYVPDDEADLTPLEVEHLNEGVYGALVSRVTAAFLGRLARDASQLVGLSDEAQARDVLSQLVQASAKSPKQRTKEQVT